MKKKLAVILMSAMVLSLAACGSSGSSKDAASDKKAAEETVEEAAGEEKEAPAEETSEDAAEEEKEAPAEEASEDAAEETAAAEDEAPAEDCKVEIVIKDYGTVTVELDADAAPITVKNFVKLVNEGFYDGLTFHRIIDGFMIQGGDPLGTGMGGSDETIKGEFSENGVDNPISHEKGVISMARADDPNSASSQFFITVADSKFLDGYYAAFGHVIDGMDVCDKIAKDAEPTDDNGTIPPAAQPVIESIRVVE